MQETIDNAYENVREELKAAIAELIAFNYDVQNNKASYRSQRATEVFHLMKDRSARASSYANYIFSTLGEEE